MKMRFADTDYNLGTTIGLSYQAGYVFRGNSINDPDFTGAGNQPYYHDQMQAIFRRYRVYASKIKVTFFPTTAAAQYIRCFVFPYQASGSLTNTEPNDYRQLPYVKNININDEQMGGRGRSSQISHYMTTGKMFGDPKWGIDSNFEAAFGSNPTKQWFWHIYTDTSSIGEEIACEADVEVTYYCELMSTESIDQS